MNDFSKHPPAMDAKDSMSLRGDPITLEPCLAAQQTRLRRCPEDLHDVLAGNPFGRR